MRKKTQLSSFDIKVLCAELKTELVGGFISKIYEPTKGEVLIRINKPVNRPNPTAFASPVSQKNSTANDTEEKTEQKIIYRNFREYEGYSVINVAFESSPGVYVTGSLYKPLKIKMLRGLP